jgi:hypothetical protein
MAYTTLKRIDKVDDFLIQEVVDRIVENVDPSRKIHVVFTPISCTKGSNDGILLEG